MSEFRVPVVKLGPIFKHTNADNLSVTVVEGETVIFRTGDYQEGDLAVYVPVEAVVPTIVPGTDFLGAHRRIKAKRLRGVYSEGLLLPLTPISLTAKEGDDLAQYLGIKKHEDKIPDTWSTSTSGASVPSRRGFWGHFFHWCLKEQLRTHEQNPGCPIYDIEPYKRHKHLLEQNQEVVITEKIHGSNFRAGVVNNKFYVGSHNHFWRNHADREPLLRERFGTWVHTKILGRTPRGKPKLNLNLYWQAAKENLLEQRIRGNCQDGLIFYGEVFGSVQDLLYGAEPGEIFLRIFDIYDTQEQEWLDWGDVVSICRAIGLDTVPVLYHGPFSEAKLLELTDGQSILANHIREGVVVKTTKSPRVILKSVSQAYKLRKGGTELQ